MKAGEEHPRSFFQNLWWLTFVRGVIAIALGIALLLYEDKPIRSMAQFMGLYWLTSGSSGIAWGTTGAKRPGLWLLLGITEVSVGAMLVFRGWFDSYLSWTTVTRLAAALAFGAGLLHVYAGIRTRQDYGRKWSWGSFCMGALQITLGLIFVMTPNDISRLVLFLASIWAFVGGVGLVTNGLRLRQTIQDGNV